MNKKTLKGLEGSIEKWRKIVAKEGMDKGTENCPLCRIFFDYIDCSGCPVAKATGEGFCEKTPYQWWHAHQIKCHSTDNWGKDKKNECPTCTRLARAELKFLESLRP